MNSRIKNINLEKILFFDIETTYKTENLEIDSPEYLAFQHKMRDKSSDELDEAHEVLELYKRKAPLYLTYNKVVNISVGFVSKGSVRVKSLSGEESEIIKDFCDIANKFEYISGVNIVGFDLPVIMANGAKYFDMSTLLKDSFSVSGKKPWELKNIIELTEVFKGTGFINPSLQEMCLHFNIPTPKDDISGADVPALYWKGESKRISDYCNKDVLASINLLQAMKHESFFTEYVNVGIEETTSFETILHELNETKMFNEDYKKRLSAELKRIDLTEQDKLNLPNIILPLYLQISDLKADKERKEKEVYYFVNNVKW